MPSFVWEDIDHSLVTLKLADLAEKMHDQIRADERRIQFENRSNLNSGSAFYLVLQMNEERADEWANKAYAIYCEVWERQGRAKSGAFVRAVSARKILPILQARENATSHEFKLLAERRGRPTEFDLQLKGFRLRMGRLQDRWRRSLEIEAKECDLASGSTPRAGYPQSSTVQSATWDTVEISLLSDHRAQVRNGVATEILNYAELGFKDGRSGNPTRAWKALCVLAAKGGTIKDAAGMGRKWPQVERRMQEIRRALKKHFGISLDPIPFVGGVGYRARFKISCSPSFNAGEVFAGRNQET